MIDPIERGARQQRIDNRQTSLIALCFCDEQWKSRVYDRDRRYVSGGKIERDCAMSTAKDIMIDRSDGIAFDWSFYDWKIASTRLSKWMCDLI